MFVNKFVLVTYIIYTKKCKPHLSYFNFFLTINVLAFIKSLITDFHFFSILSICNSIKWPFTNFKNCYFIKKLI